MVPRNVEGWFDALIVEAAIRSRCERLYSEALVRGQDFGALRVSKPFDVGEVGS